MDFKTIWDSTPSEVLARLSRYEFVRGVLLSKAKKRLYNELVVINEDNRPPGVQEGRCLILQNLLETINRALSDGRIAPQVSRAIIRNLLGSTIINERELTEGFLRRHGFGPPRLILISPTKRCNLACKGCYAGSSSGNFETMSFDVLDRILREKKEQWGSHFTGISGGEPLLYREGEKSIFDVFERHRDDYFMMYTNGTLITREAARRLAELGNVTPAISVEGFERETDGRRGKGVFGKILKAMDNLRSAGVPFGISATATRLNYETIVSDEFIDRFFDQEGAIYGWIFQYMPIGRSFTIDLMATPEQRLAMFKKEQRIIKERKLFLVDFWNGGAYSNGCISAGRTGGYLYIDWNGNVSPCTFFPYYVSNMYDVYREGGTLTDVLMTPFFRSIRRWQDDYAYAQPPERVNNLVTPCPIRDHYAEAFGLVRGFNARAVDVNAEKAIADPEYRRRMIAYGSEIRSLTEEMWEAEFMKRPSPAAGRFDATEAAEASRQA